VSLKLGMALHGNLFNLLLITARSAFRSIIENMVFTEDNVTKYISIHPGDLLGYSLTALTLYPSILLDLRTVPHHQ
jgi:hypothetical protein